MRLQPFPKAIALGLILVFGLAILLPGLSLLQLFSTARGRVEFASETAPLEMALPKNMRGHYQLKQQYDMLRYRLWGRVPLSILQGKDGWLYFHSDNAKDSVSILDYKGALHYSSLELSRAQENLKRKQQLADSLGYRYLAVLAPNKTTSYPYALPDTLRHQRGMTRWEHARSQLQGILEHNILNLVDAVRSPDSIHPYFYKTDSHWNDLGALTAYYAIASAMGWNPLDTTHWLRDSVNYSGDLLRMAHFENQIHERTLRIRPPSPGKARNPDGTYCLRPDWNQSEITPFYKGRASLGARMQTTNNQHAGKAIVFHDSYTIFLLPYLAEHLGNTLWIWGPFDSELIKREQPQIVIEIRVERYLSLLLGL